MKALILAAGRGKRLQQSKPKPLTPLLGLTLIERSLHTLKEAGIDEAVIVVGYRGREIINYLQKKTPPIRLQFVENTEWELGNGTSVLSAKPVLEGEHFLLMMCDHIFETGIITRLMQPRKRCAITIDHNLDHIFDLEDATKLQIEHSTPLRIGKRLETFNAVDCGIFYATPELFTALETARAEKKYQLTDAVQHLIKQHRIDTVDVTGKFWMDLDTPESLQHAEQHLLHNLTKPTDGIISRTLNRRISRHITRLLTKTNITPNQITLAAFSLIPISALFFATGNWLHLVIGALLIQASSILDGCDGEIARLKFQKSRYGGFLDSTLDRYADALIILSLAYGHWRQHADASVYLIGFFALMGVFAFSYTNARYEDLFENTHIHLHLRRDLRLLILALGALANQVVAALLILAVLTNLEVTKRLVSLRIQASTL